MDNFKTYRFTIRLNGIFTGDKTLDRAVRFPETFARECSISGVTVGNKHWTPSQIQRVTWVEV